MRCPRCKHELHQAGRERDEHRDLLAHTSGLVADLIGGADPRKNRFVRVAAKSVIEQVRKLGIKPRRIFTSG